MTLVTARLRPLPEIKLLLESGKELQQALLRFDLLRYSAARNPEIPVLDVIDRIDDLAYRAEARADEFHALIEASSNALLRESGLRI